MRLIDADALINSGYPTVYHTEFGDAVINIEDIEKAPTEKGQFEEKVIELFNKYDPLLLHIDGKISPVKNTTKQECYDLLYEIGELIEWRRVLFKKYLGGNE